MITKLPIAGNQVTGAEGSRGRLGRGFARTATGVGLRAAGERGIALVSVVAVLVLLAIVSTPFLVSMRDSAARGQKFLYSARADWEAESLFERVRSHLTLSLEHIERRKLDASNAGAVDGGRPPNDATPTSDTLAEITLPRTILDEFNRDAAREQRVWDVEIIDLQGRLNANNCSYPVLANILGRTELGDQLASDDTRVPLVDGTMFPEDGGVVRIGTEVIKYEQRLGNELSGCERGYRGDVPGNSAAGDWDQGDVVILEAAYQIATRPFRARPGAYVRYTNVYQLRRIADQGVTALSPEQFDSLRPFVTTWNGNIVGDGWSNPQVVRNAITSADSSQRYADIKNNRYFGEGTIFRITDGVNNDYGVITKVRGDSQVLLGGNIQHDYSADQSRIYALARSPVNLNVADEDLLTVVFSGLKVRGRGTAIPIEKARRIAKHLKEWTVSDEETPGVYRNWKDFTNALEAARDDMGIINGDEFQALLLNAMNANDALLSFSTVPFVFRSFDLYQVDATAAIMDSTGRELARRELSRVFHASSTRSGTFVVETQDDFQRHIMKSRDSKWYATFPDNINAYYDFKNIPASEYDAFATKSRFPSTDRSDGVGDVRLLPAAYRFTARGTTDRVHHFDSSDKPDGLDISQEELTFTADGPYSVEDRQADIVDLQDIPGVGSGIEMGLKEFAYSMWYQPKWSRSGGEEVIFDYGADGDHTNRVSLRYDGERDVLSLAVADATRETRSCEIFYEFDHTTWDADQWYHIGVHVAGCHPSLIELFIDGEKQGRASGITRTTSNIAPTGILQEVRVEDASSFPDYGVIMIRAEEGMELFEYTSRTDNSFILSRRKARNIDVTDEQNEPRTHLSGAVVELYGFAGTLLSDIRRGGSTTDSAFGPFRIYRFHYYGQEAIDADSGNRICLGLAATQSHSFPISDITLTEWDTGSADQDILDDLGQTGTEGLALLIGPGQVLDPAQVPAGVIVGNAGDAPVGQGDTQSLTFGGAELVAYRVTGTGKVEITARNLTSAHVDFDPNGGDGNPRFIPGYAWAEDAASALPENGFQRPPSAPTEFGSKTAFIPVALVGQGVGEYLNPLDEEPQLAGFAYAQVDGEWFKYDTYDDQVLPGKVAFYRDSRWDEIAVRLNAPGLSAVQVTSQPSTGAAGGSGGNSAGVAEPPRAPAVNDENTLPPEPQPGSAPSGTAESQGSKDWKAPEETAFELAQDADFRGMLLPNQQTEQRVANTIPAEHSAGTNIIPCFLMAAGNDLATGDIRRGVFPGFDDLLTLRDANLNDEHVRVQWGYQGWAGLTQVTTQTWNWDRPQQVAHLRSFDSRMWTRALKFPTRELPDAGLTTGEEFFRIGTPYNNPGATSAAIVDEAWFAGFDSVDPGRAKYAYLGEVPPELLGTFQQNATGTPPDPRFGAIDDQVDEFAVNFPYFDDVQLATVVNGLPIDANLFDDDGGVIRIDDELIIYSDFDTNSGLFSGCVRGAFGTEPRQHEFGAIVAPIRTFATSVLVSDADESSAAFDVADATDFPDDGYIRIGDSLELIGYTERGANTLSGPLGRIDPTTVRETGADARVGGGLFRGRFGTGQGVRGYASGEVAVAMPFRHYDRYAEYSDDAELSYTQLTWTKPGAVWKRITWDEDPRQNVEIIALVRFAGGPAWDSADVILVGQQAMPTVDRRKHLYEISDPKAENLLNVESDRCEVRLQVRFVTGAYDRFADVAPDNWKETPRIQKVVVEYVAPPQVLYEDN